MKNLYKIYQEVNSGYDSYSDAVVCAENEEQARCINPGGFYKWHDGEWFFQYSNGTEQAGNDGSWCDLKDVKVKEIGVANDELEVGTIVCSSFHAG